MLAAALATLLLVADGHSGGARFTDGRGRVIRLDSDAGRLALPGRKATRLRDCSNMFQTCLTNGRGFAFSYFNTCDSTDYRRLKFRPKIVSALHDNLWMVFDAAPNFMFHYVIPKGVVGIYMGRTPTFDFRTLLRERNLSIADLDAQEFRIADLDVLAACRQ